MFFVEAAVTNSTADSNYQSINDFWLFVVYCLVVIVVVIFFSFYFNRALGQIVTFLINQYTWRRYNTYIEVDSIRVSILGGRILFKNLRYLSTNQSISILKGHITIQYWLLNVRKTENNKNDKSSNLPCRIFCCLEGLEWFFYNNTPAYDKMKDILGLATGTNTTTNTNLEGDHILHGELDPENQTPINVDTSLMERLMPIQFEVTTGAVMIGNTDIKSMLVCKTTQANGIYTITNSRSPLDYCKYVIDVVLRKPQFSLKENMDYSSVDENSNAVTKPVQKLAIFDYILRPLRHLYPFAKVRQYGEMQHMQNLMDERRQQTNDTDNTTYHEEYARVMDILECNEMAISYYADSPGPVPPPEASNSFSGIGIDIGNGGLPPEWGIKLSLWDATLHYGPWTDRQRTEMQDYFFPNSHRGNIPTERLVPGQLRVATVFETYIEFMNEGQLRIPTREKSKDWKFTSGISELDVDTDGYSTRPYGWFNVKAGEGSFVKVVTPFVCGPKGLSNIVDVVLKNTDITTSVNYASFLQSNKIEINIDMPAPLQWNGFRHWGFKINAKKPTVFLLRDHIYLLQDLIKDWASPPPADLLHFTPVTYQLQCNLDNPLIYLCVNEHNIINYPNSIKDNAYFKIHSHRISADIILPFTEFQPETTGIKFSVVAEHSSVGLSLQKSHTFNSFMREDDAHTAVAVNLTLDGTYESYNTVDVLRHIESCNLNIKINGATVKLFGTLIRYVLILKDNYFGAWNNFSTIDEYRQNRSNHDEWLEQKKKQSEAKPLADPFEVYLLLEVEDGVALFPENLYECASYSQLEFQELQLELRNLDVYLDLYINVSPITLSRDSNPSYQTTEGFYRIKNARDPKNYVYIDSLNLYAHRLFGPLPECATYVCQWEFDVGRITGEVKPSLLLGLAGFGQTFAYNLIDEDNAVPQEMKTKDLPDVTFVKFFIREVDICLMSMNSATNFSLSDGVLLEFDNLINVKYSQRITIKIPTILTRFLANPDQARGDPFLDGGDYSWVEVAKADLGLNITIFRHTASWKDARREQQNFIRTQDYATRRCVRLYEEADASSQLSLTSARSTSEHHVGVIYAPPFRPFMFGRVEDKSILYDSSHSSHALSSDHGRYANYSSSGSIASGKSSSVSDLLQSDFEDTDLDNISYKAYSTKSGISKDNDSFHTAKSSDYDDIFNYDAMEDDYSFSSHNESDSTSDDEPSLSIGQREQSSRKSKSTPESNLTAAIPPSIPYRDYLKRYKIKRSYTEYNYSDFFHTFTPPSHPQFIPEKEFEEKTRPVYEKRKEDGKDYFSQDNDSFDGLGDDVDTSDAFGKGSEVIATTIIEATRPVTILVTPIVIKIVQELAEEIITDDWDLESMLDALQMKYIEQLTRFLTNQYICTRFAVILPETYLHFIQNVTVPDNLPLYKNGESYIKTQYNPEENVLCSADIFFNDFKMIGSVKFEDYAYNERKDKVVESNLQLQEVRLHLDIGDMGSTVQYVSNQYDRRSFAFGIPYENLRNKNLYGRLHEEDTLKNELIVLDLAVNDFSFKLLGAKKPNYVELAVKNVDSVIITESVEILVGAVYSWLIFVDDLKGILESFQDKRTRQVQVFINEIANFSLTQAVAGDPIFLTAPGTMLGGLGSKNFRNDCGWKLLARMRHCLRSMPSSKREELQYRLTSGGALHNLKSDEMYINVVQTFSHWRNWEIGYDDIANCRLFTQPFNKLVELGKNTNKNMTNEVIKFLTSSSNFAKLRLGNFKFTIYEEETADLHKEENSISFGPSEFLLECLYKNSPISGTGENYIPENSHKLIAMMDGYVDIIARVSLGTINISMNPIIMAFARHMILVQRVFTDKILNLQHATKLSKTPNSQRIENTSQVISATSETITLNSEFDIDALLSRIDVVAQLLISLDQIQVVAHAHELRMDANISGIQGSALFSNPKLAPLQLQSSHVDRDSDTGSGKRSSTRGRKSIHSDPRLVLEAACGINLIDIKFSEQLRVNTNNTSNILLGIMLDKANVNANISQITKISKKLGKLDTTKDVLNVFSNIHKFQIHIPQSLLKLYGFVESWQTEQGRRFNFLFQNLVKEWEEQRKEQPASAYLTPSEFDSTPTNNPVPTTKKMDLKLQFLLNEFVIQADLLPSLSAEYSILDFFIMVNETHQKSMPVQMYTFQLSKQVIQLITKDSKKSKSDLTKSENISTFSIPGIRSTGSLKTEIVKGESQMKLRSAISVDVISMSLDVSLIDSLLTAQSLLGNEVSELIEVLSYSKPKSTPVASSSSELNQKKSSRIFKYTVDVSLDGLSISASSPSAVGMFRSNLLEASISNDKDMIESSNELTWKLQARNFSLSLDHNIVENIDNENNMDDTEYRRNCLAYILVDFSVQNYLPLCKKPDCKKETHTHDLDKKSEAIFIEFTRIQTVMQPIALGKLAEMYIYYDSELSKKKLKKKNEIEKLSANTKRIVQTISIKNDWPKALQDEPQSLLKGRTICLHVRRIGIAIPLDAQSDLPSAETSKGVGALLFSITSVEFLTKNVEKGALQLDNITLQFVKKFDQNKSDHFIAENHPKMNHITFPLISCHVSATNVKPLQIVKADANVQGFDVDVDGTIADYLNTLSIIYVKCKDRVDAFTAKANFNSKNNLSLSSTELKPSSSNESKSEVVNLNIECRFTCESGIIRMYPKNHSSNVQKSKKKKSSLGRPEFEYKVGEGNMATVEIPGLSAWITYETPLGAHATVLDIPKRFHGDVLIRESRNTLNPALVQFLREVVAGLKLGIQQSSERKAVRNAASVTESNMNMSLFLRLSKTQLDLTCQPTSKVVCTLGWEESEFLMNSFSSDATSRTMSCVGSVRAITVMVKHNFSPEPCLNARVDRILFNAMLTSQRQDGGLDDDISIIIEIPNVLGDINVRHLQDLLVLKAYWFTQPMSDNSVVISQSDSSTSHQLVITDTTLVVPTSQATSPPFSIHIALLIKDMQFSSDLGQNIGKITFIPTALSFQAHHVPFKTKGLSLSLEDIKIVSEGRLSGNAYFNRTVLQARIDQTIVDGDHKETASVCVRSDGFNASFQYEYQNLLDVIQQSLELNIDYRKVPDIYEFKISIQLEALIARLSIKTVPVIITMVQKFNELLQKKKSEAGIGIEMNSYLKPKDNKKQTKPKESSSRRADRNPMVHNQVVLLIKAVEVVIYPSQFQDTDNVDVRAKQFEINLEQLPQIEAGVPRKLSITIQSAALAKNVPGKELMVRYSQPLPPASSKPKGLGGTKIFGIPGTKVIMESTQLDRNIEYSFDAEFDGRIGVSLNYGLIKQLQEMVTMFKSQLDRALDKNSHNEIGTPISMSSTFEENEDGLLSVTSSRRPSMRPGSSNSRIDSDNLSIPPSPSFETLQDAVDSDQQQQTNNGESSSGQMSQEQEYIYTSVGSVNFQPQLQVMGDATPPVEWLGLKRERIPGLVHENLTLHLDKVVQIIWKILESQAD